MVYLHSLPKRVKNPKKSKGQKTTGKYHGPKITMGYHIGFKNPRTDYKYIVKGSPKNHFFTFPFVSTL